MKWINGYLWMLVAGVFVMSACRDENEIFIPEEETVGKPTFSEINGFYLLNEGNMGSNKSTLDYYDYNKAVYQRNIYGFANPSVPKELGDVGNDIKIYGGRIYAVINCSNKVEVMDKFTAKRLGQIEIPNCRYIQFKGGFAYVTSYAGPVEINPNYEQIGYVAKVDTASLAVVDRCLVGFQPDELEIVGNKMYVANSGGYMTPNYENTVSVIDMKSFKEIKRIEVAKNLHRLRADRHGMLWVTSRGDYYKQPSRLYYVNTKTDQLVDSVQVPVSNFCLKGDSLFVYSVEWSYVAMENTVTYAIVNVATKRVVTDKFITDGTDELIKVPYGMAVNPLTEEVFVTDAKNYVSPGTLYCFDNKGQKKWSVRTGDIPAHIVFLGK